MNPNTLDYLRRIPRSTRDECTITAWHAGREELKKENKIQKIEPIKHVVNVHERCETDIEILTTDQWFIKYLELKEEFLKKGKEMTWFPPHMRVRFDNWILGLKWDWNISRQRHFGVPIPVWYCEKCGEIMVAEESQLPVDPL